MQLSHRFAEQLPELCHAVKPFPVKAPRVAMLNKSLANELGVSTECLKGEYLFSLLFNDTHNPAIKSVAQKYGGHQFGQWNPHLGDGRGVLLGELKTPKGTFVDLHLKGSGQTPYSRHADGRAVLRSSIREYLASEALHKLNIPTSRALCLIASEEPLKRDFMESAAMIIRTCPSHIRFGHFEYFFHSKQWDLLDQLFDYCFTYYFQTCTRKDKPYLAMLTDICQRTGHMIACWQAYGFNHGVMNTDNMSIHGITFDYGPYTFLDDYIPGYICNKSDHTGRYAFDKQASIALWNLNALAHAFSSKLNIDELKKALATFEPSFLQHYRYLMQQRLGLNTNDTASSSACINGFLALLRDEAADYHLSFLYLTEHLLDIEKGEVDEFAKHFKNSDAFSEWALKYKSVLLNGKADWHTIQNSMYQVNPRYVLRNHFMQEAINRAETGDFTYCDSLFKAVSQPTLFKPEFEIFSKAPKQNQKGIALSCSS
ncbi:protein adenylyltransferase SelO [Agaribacter flavus]|uniref:Protein nucleotidyltransferase YdiU n=1 Tax=Agaribacter flavus TaxID=1902781 RepID=A0ABV7FWW7_9ALTE